MFETGDERQSENGWNGGFMKKEFFNT